MEFEYGRSSSLLDKKYKEFFMPTVLTAMATSASIIVDGIIVGNLLGSAALAAVNLSLPVVMVYNIFAVLFGMGAATVISVAKGRRENKLADEVFTVSFAAMIVLGLSLLLIQSGLIDQIALSITDDRLLFPLVRDYLSILIYASPLLVIVPGMVYELRTDGKVKLASLVLIGANAVNLILDIVYIKIFDMGIKGASLATLCGYAVGFLLFLIYFSAQDRTLKFDWAILKKPFDFMERVGKIVMTGMPSALSSSLMPFKIFFINLIVLSTAGKTGMAVFSVCISCLSLISMFISGAAQTMSPIVGTLYGEKDYRGIGFVVKRAFKILLGANVIVVGFLEISPGIALGLFGVTDPGEVAIGVQALRIFAVSLLGTSITFLLLYYYMTVGRRKIANLISMLQGFVVVIPFAWLLSKLWGINGVWAAFILAEAVTLATVFVYYLAVKRKSKQKISNMLLLEEDQDSECRSYDLSIKNRLEDAVGLSEKTIDFLQSSGLAGKSCNRVGIAIEEMVANTIRYGYKKEKENTIDIKIKVLADEIIISLRDDGDYFDPIKYHDTLKETGNEQTRLGGISMVYALAETVEYNRVLGLNNTRIVIKI